MNRLEEERKNQNQNQNQTSENENTGKDDLEFGVAIAVMYIIGVLGLFLEPIAGISLIVLTTVGLFAYVIGRMLKRK